MPRSGRRLSAGLLPAALFGLALLAPVSLYAQSGGGERESAEETTAESARKHYRLGARAFRDGDTESAIDHFRRAYELKRDGMLLYNLALVHTASGRPEKARRYAERAGTSGDLTDHASVRNTSRLAGLRVATTARDLAKASDATTADATEQTTPEPETTASSEPTGRPRPPTVPDSADTRDSSRNHILFWSGLSVAGIGLGGLAGAGLLELSLRDDIRDYRDAARAGRGSRYRELDARIRRRQRLGRTLLFGGAIATGLGAAVATVDAATRGAPAPLRLAATPTPTADGLLVTVTTR